MKLLIIGDSSAAGVGVADQADALSGQLAFKLAGDFQVDWQLISKTGATTKTALQWVQSSAPERADVVVVALGVNDVTRGTPAFQFMRRQKTLCDLLRARFQARHIVLSAVPPVGDFPALTPLLRRVLGPSAKRFGTRLENWCETQADCTYLKVDLDMHPDVMAADGFHPSAKTYALWAEAAADEIRRLKMLKN